MKLILSLFLFSSLALYSQELPLNSENFEDYIKEVYQDKAELLIFSKPEQLERKKKLLERVFIINGVGEKKDDFLDFENLYLVTTYNKGLKKNLPDDLDANQFNPFLYKMDIYNHQPVYYYYSKTRQLIKIYPSTD